MKCGWCNREVEEYDPRELNLCEDCADEACPEEDVKMKDQATRLLEAIKRHGGDTGAWERTEVPIIIFIEIDNREKTVAPGWYHVTTNSVTKKTTMVHANNATPTEIKALAWELAMILQETLVLHDRCWTKEPVDEYDDDRWFVQHKDSIEALLLAAGKGGGDK